MFSFDPLRSDSPLIVYVDIKSPYAFIAIEPTFAIEDELGIEADWRPLTLDIPSYLGSARLDEQGNVAEQDRTAEQWAAVKYAYRDARRYAALRGLTLRGTVKIWDTSIVHIGLMWAKRQGRDILRAYLRGIYVPFWRRELDAEDSMVVASVLEQAGADMSGWPSFLAGEGRAEHDAMQPAIFDAGVFGVPSYVADGELFFGRENLPRVRWLLGGRQGPAPDIAYRRFGEGGAGASVVAASGASLTVAVDFKQPQSYLAVQPTIDLAEELGVEVDWLPAQVPPLATPSAPSASDDRGARHLRLRAHYFEQDLHRYAEARGLSLCDVHRTPDSSLAAKGLLWAKQCAASAGPDPVQGYVARIFERYWRGELDLEDRAAIGGVLDEVGLDGAAFDPEAMQADFDRSQQRLRDAGVIGAPAYLVEDDLFIGRQHLPMVRWLLAGKPGSGPI
jgi:2-hydroxychromene-2-carboxylate isomerase